MENRKTKTVIIGKNNPKLKNLIILTKAFKSIHLTPTADTQYQLRIEELVADISAITNDPDTAKKLPSVFLVMASAFNLPPYDYVINNLTTYKNQKLKGY